MYNNEFRFSAYLEQCRSRVLAWRILGLTRVPSAWFIWDEWQFPVIADSSKFGNLDPLKENDPVGVHFLFLLCHKVKWPDWLVYAKLMSYSLKCEALKPTRECLVGKK